MRDGLFEVGRHTCTPKQLDELHAPASWAPGDVVDLLLEDGRIVRERLRSVVGERSLRIDVADHTRLVSVQRARRPLGWQRVDGCQYHRTYGPVPVPATCPALDELASLAGQIANYHARAQARALVELVRAHNQALRASAAQQESP